MHVLCGSRWLEPFSKSISAMSPTDCQVGSKTGQTLTKAMSDCGSFAWAVAGGSASCIATRCRMAPARCPMSGVALVTALSTNPKTVEATGGGGSWDASDTVCQGLACTM